MNAVTDDVPFHTPRPGVREKPPKGDRPKQPPRHETEAEEERQPGPASGGQDRAQTQIPTTSQDKQKDRLVKPETDE